MASPFPTPAIKKGWESIAQRKYSDREAELQKYPSWRLKGGVSPDEKNVIYIIPHELSPVELEIVQLDATGLLEAIRTRRYTSLQVIQAYCHTASVAQDLTNCLTEVFFDDALKRAKELDRYIEETGRTLGPLHGLPVSIKDHIMIKGKDTSTGYIAWCYNTVATEDAVAVDILRKAGAVLYVKTNNPQTLLSLETNNNVFGRTNNPYDRSRTSGGSSGGESALIACLGSPLGLGTDIGGSIRLPAACTGLYGFKGSVGRMPHKGLMGSHAGLDAIIGCLGPMARSARDLSLFCKTMLDYKPWLDEAPLLEIPWNQNIVDGDGLPKQLCFAILWDDQVVRPEPAIHKALMLCKNKLTAAGHVVIDWDINDPKNAWDLLMKLYFLDGGKEYEAVLEESGEPANASTKWIMDQICNRNKDFSIRETFNLNLKREEFRQKLLLQWNNTAMRTGTGRPVDAIISPVAPTLAPKHESTTWWGYTSYWNLADYPAAVFPLRRSSAPGELPVCLQLIGRRLNEEQVLGILNIVDRLVNVTD